MKDDFAAVAMIFISAWHGSGLLLNSARRNELLSSFEFRVGLLSCNCILYCYAVSCWQVLWRNFKLNIKSAEECCMLENLQSSSFWDECRVGAVVKTQNFEFRADQSSRESSKKPKNRTKLKLWPVSKWRTAGSLSANAPWRLIRTSEHAHAL